MTLRASSMLMHLEAIRAGTGRGVLPCYVGDGHPLLERLTPPIPEIAAEYWIIVHRDLRRSACVRAVIDWIKALFAEQRDIIAGVVTSVELGQVRRATSMGTKVGLMRLELPSVITALRVADDPCCGGRGRLEETTMLGIDAAGVSSHRAPWNKGRLIGQKRPLKPKEVWAIRVRLQLEERRRDLALFNLALDSKLRGCDLVRLQVNDVCVEGQVRDRATVIQRKTGRPVQFEITEQTRAAIRDWVANSVPGNGQYLFPSRFHDQPHISTRQYARIVHRSVERAGLDSSAYGTHSMRRTKAAQIYKKTGNLRAVQLLLGHTKLESTVRYLGIEVDDALSISEQVEL